MVQERRLVDFGTGFMQCPSESVKGVAYYSGFYWYNEYSGGILDYFAMDEDNITGSKTDPGVVGTSAAIVYGNVMENYGDWLIYQVSMKYAGTPRCRFVGYDIDGDTWYNGGVGSLSSSWEFGLIGAYTGDRIIYARDDTTNIQFYRYDISAGSDANILSSLNLQSARHVIGGLRVPPTGYQFICQDVSGDVRIVEFDTVAVTITSNVTDNTITFPATPTPEKMRFWKRGDTYYVLTQNGFYKSTDLTNWDYFVEAENKRTALIYGTGNTVPDYVMFDNKWYVSIGNDYTALKDYSFSGGCGMVDFCVDGSFNIAKVAITGYDSLTEGLLSDKVKELKQFDWVDTGVIAVNDGIDLYDDNGTGLFIGKVRTFHLDDNNASRFYSADDLYKKEFDEELTGTTYTWDGSLPTATGVNIIFQNLVDERTRLSYTTGATGTIHVSGEVWNTTTLRTDGNDLYKCLTDVSSDQVAIWYTDADDNIYLKDWDTLVDSEIDLSQDLTVSDYKFTVPVVDKQADEITQVILYGGMVNGKRITATAGSAPVEGNIFIKSYSTITDQTTLNNLATNLLNGTADQNIVRVSLTIQNIPLASVQVGEYLDLVFTYIPELDTSQKFLIDYKEHDVKSLNCYVELINGIIIPKSDERERE